MPTERVTELLHVRALGRRLSRLLVAGLLVVLLLLPGLAARTAVATLV